MSRICEFLAALPGLPRDDYGPIFTEIWQRRAFALVVQLVERNHFTWSEWSRALSTRIRAAGNGRVYDPGEYYRYWIEALERLVIEKGLSDAATLRERMNTLAGAAQPRSTS